MIDAIIAVVEENFADIGLIGNNGDFGSDGIDGHYDIEIVNSRDSADPFGSPNVSRVIIGGTRDELGIPFVSIVESLDVGNFETAETGVVLLDTLSGPSDERLGRFSINSILRAPGVSIIDVIGQVVGNIVSAEAGHFFGNWHTSGFNAIANIMDTGNFVPGVALEAGVGEDGIFGTNDDIDLDFGRDSFLPEEGFTGTANTLNTIAFGLSTGTTVESVQIDIKPGSFPNSINLGSKGTIPVAIFSTSTFDATTIDPLTVTLAEAKTRLRGKGTPMASLQDVNGDGLLDLVVHVETEALALTETDTQAELLGATFDGVPIQGFDPIRVVAALHVAGGPAEGVFVGNGLTHATLNPVVQQSLAYWTAAGVEPHRLDTLRQLDVQIADLSDSLLGIAALNRVWIDRDAAGYGWSVNAGGVDLFSAVTHEFGHVLGFDHDEMGATLASGVRQLALSDYSASFDADYGFGSLRNLGLSAGFDTFSASFFTTYTTHPDDSIRTTTTLDQPFETLLLLFDHEGPFRIVDAEDDESELTAKAAGLLFRRSGEAEEFEHLFAEFQKRLAEAI